jgi:hypothetical protein
MVASKGAKVYGIVNEVDAAGKMKGQAMLSMTLTDMQVGDRVLAVKTQPVSVQGGKGTGTKKVVGGAALGAAIGAIAGGGKGAAIGAAAGGGAGGVAAAASQVKAGGDSSADAAGLHSGRAAGGGDHDERRRACGRRELTHEAHPHRRQFL